MDKDVGKLGGSSLPMNRFGSGAQFLRIEKAYLSTLNSVTLNSVTLTNYPMPSEKAS